MFITHSLVKNHADPPLAHLSAFDIILVTSTCEDKIQKNSTRFYVTDIGIKKLPRVGLCVGLVTQSGTDDINIQ